MRHTASRLLLLIACLVLPLGYVCADQINQPADQPIDQPAEGSSGSVQTPNAATIDGGAPDSPNQYNQMMERCKVVDSDGNGLIRPYMADSGVNLAGDANAWIWVPYGQCAKINAGDFNGISPDILAKITTSNIQSAPTLGN